MAPGLVVRPLRSARAIMSAFVRNAAPSMCACSEPSAHHSTAVIWFTESPAAAALMMA